MECMEESDARERFGGKEGLRVEGRISEGVRE